MSVSMHGLSGHESTLPMLIHPLSDKRNTLSWSLLVYFAQHLLMYSTPSYCSLIAASVAPSSFHPCPLVSCLALGPAAISVASLPSSFLFWLLPWSVSRSTAASAQEKGPRDHPFCIHSRSPELSCEIRAAVKRNFDFSSAVFHCT